MIFGILVSAFYNLDKGYSSTVSSPLIERCTIISLTGHSIFIISRESVMKFMLIAIGASVAS